MAAKKLRPVHAGDILLRDFMQPLELSSYKVAKELGVAAPTVNEIVRRRRAISAEMALRLSRSSERRRSSGRTCRHSTIWGSQARGSVRKLSAPFSR